VLKNEGEFFYAVQAMVQLALSYADDKVTFMSHCGLDG
jgi:hypothetical protein